VAATRGSRIFLLLWGNGIRDLCLERSNLLFESCDPLSGCLFLEGGVAGAAVEGGGVVFDHVVFVSLFGDD
jgi:hypothetical protein